MRLAMLAALTTAAALLAGTAGEARGAAPSVVDRTYRCVVPPLYDQVREIRVGVSPSMELPAAGGTRTVPALISVVARTGGFGDRSLLFASFGPDSGRGVGSIGIDPKACTLQKAAIPLASRGLPGPPVLFNTSGKCPSTRAVLVRFRAVVDRTPRWRKQGDYLTASVNVVEAKLAVRSLGNAPIGFIAVSRAGTSQAFLSPRCD